MDRIIIRSDDWDFRLDTQQYIDAHEEFKKRGLIETMAIQPTTWGKLSNYHQDLIDYVNKELDAGTYDLQVHGWQHAHYDEMEMDFVVRDLMATKYFCIKYFGRDPKIFFTPWNCMSNNLERAAQFVGMEVSNESNDIWRFIREAKVDKFSGKTLYVHLWKADEMALFIEMLDLVVKIEKERGNL